MKMVNAMNYTLHYSFNEPATTTMLGIVDLHHTIFGYLILVFVLVMWLLIDVILNAIWYKKKVVGKFHECPYLEAAWTMLPSFLVVSILFPSLSLLYSADQYLDPELTLKVIGHQWYWSYEYSDYAEMSKNIDLVFDSTMKHPALNFVAMPFVMVPVNVIMRFLVTSADVLHSWAIPAWGVKMDAVPGRANQVVCSVYNTGIYYGQCSELCGVGHGFMPITISVVLIDEFFEYIFGQEIYLSRNQGQGEQNTNSVDDEDVKLLTKKLIKKLRFITLLLPFTYYYASR